MPVGKPKLLTGVWGFSASNVFAVGRGETILHYGPASAK